MIHKTFSHRFQLWMQHITFAHWLPTIIGHEGMRDIGPYKGYNASEVI